VVPYVGKHVEATHEELFVVEFRCAHCGIKVDAEVLGKGRGVGNSPFFLDNAGAAQRAREGAWETAARNARAMARLARCPLCDRRSRGAWLGFLVASAFQVLGLSLPFFLFGWWLSGSHRHDTVGAVLIAVSLVVAVAAYAQWVHPKWAGAAQRLRFLPAKGQPVRAPGRTSPPGRA
jgi:hypothetical protein